MAVGKVLAAGDIEEEIAQPSMRAPGREPTPREKVLQYLDEEAKAVKESQVGLPEASPVSLETSIGGIPEPEEGEGGFSSFINDPRVVQAAVLGLGILGSQSGDIGGAVADGFIALGQLHEVRQEREQGEFRNEVAKEKINITRRSAQINEEQLTEQQRSALAARVQESKRLQINARLKLLELQDTEDARKDKTAAQKAITGKQGYTALLNYLARTRNAYNQFKFNNPESPITWDQFREKELRGLRKDLVGFDGLINPFKAKIPDGDLPKTSITEEEPGLISQVWGWFSGQFSGEEGGDAALDPVVKDTRTDKEKALDAKTGGAMTAEETPIGRFLNIGNPQRRVDDEGKGVDKEAATKEELAGQALGAQMAKLGQTFGGPPTGTRGVNLAGPTTGEGFEGAPTASATEPPIITKQSELAAIPVGAQYRQLDVNGNLVTLTKEAVKLK